MYILIFISLKARGGAVAGAVPVAGLRTLVGASSSFLRERHTMHGASVQDSTRQEKKMGK